MMQYYRLSCSDANMAGVLDCASSYLMLIIARSMRRNTDFSLVNRGIRKAWMPLRTRPRSGGWAILGME